MSWVSSCETAGWQAGVLGERRMSLVSNTAEWETATKSEGSCPAPEERPRGRAVIAYPAGKIPTTRSGMQSGKVQVTGECGLPAAHSSCPCRQQDEEHEDSDGTHWGACKGKPAMGWEIRGHLQPFNFINQRCQALRKQLCTTIIRLMVTTIMIIKLLE